MGALDRGEVAIVTGGGSGIGRAVAKRLREDGFHVVAADLRPPAAADRLLGVECDVTVPQSVAAMFAAAEEIGPVAAVVTSAGVTSKSRIDELKVEEWRRVLDVNLTGTMLAVKHGVRAMRRARGGSIVAITSVAAFRTSSALNATYAASKGGVIGFVKALVHELSPVGIRVNAVAPGFIESPLTAQLGEAWNASRRAITPLGRLGAASEIAAVVSFLASSDASYVTGEVVVVDGGAMSVLIAPATGEAITAP